MPTEPQTQHPRRATLRAAAAAIAFGALIVLWWVQRGSYRRMSYPPAVIPPSATQPGGPGAADRPPGMPDPRSLNAYTPPTTSDLTVTGDADGVMKSEPADLPVLALPAPANVRRDSAIERKLDGIAEQVAWYSVSNAVWTDIHAFYAASAGKLGYRADSPAATTDGRSRTTFSLPGDTSKKIVVTTLEPPSGVNEPIRVVVTFRYAIPR